MDDGHIPLAAITNGNNLFIQLLIILILIGVNAFFAASEIALLQINEQKFRRLAEEGNKKAKSVLKLTEDTSRLLSTIQIGVTFSGFLSSAFAADTFADILAEKIAGLGSWININVVQTICVIVITVLLSFITLVFGELVPKKLAIKYSEKLAFMSVKPIKFTAAIFAPFIKVLTVSVNGILKLLHINPDDTADDVTEEDIIDKIDEATEQGVLDNDESELISNAIEFSDITAEEIMIPRVDAVTIEDTASYADLIKCVKESRFSRFPVFHENADNIIGVFHIRNLLLADSKTFSITNYLNEPIFVPASQKIDDVLARLKKEKQHLAIVIDEFGGTAGIITMEDILEELVGSIQDEYDETEETENVMIQKADDGSYSVDAGIEIDMLNDSILTEIPTEEFSTLNGFLIDLFGRIPTGDENAQIMYNNIRFTVLESTNKLIGKVKIEIIPEEEEQ